MLSYIDDNNKEYLVAYFSKKLLLKWRDQVKRGQRKVNNMELGPEAVPVTTQENTTAMQVSYRDKPACESWRSIRIWEPSIIMSYITLYKHTKLFLVGHNRKTEKVIRVRGPLHKNSQENHWMKMHVKRLFKHAFVDAYHILELRLDPWLCILQR